MRFKNDMYHIQITNKLSLEQINYIMKSTLIIIKFNSTYIR